MRNYKIIYLILRIALIILTVFLFFSNICSVYGIGDIISQGDSFTAQGKASAGANTTSMVDVVKPIGNVLWAIGFAVAVGVGMVLGLRYMSSNDQNKAQVKQRLIWYLVAVALIFGASGITQTVLKVFSATTNNNN